MSKYIDLHTHLLPGLDDGVKDMVQALEILKQAKKAGFSTVAATPHRIETVYEADDRTIETAMAELESAMDDDEKLELIAGVEHYLDDRFFIALDKGPLKCLGNSKVILVELPMMHMPPFTAEYAFKIRLKGYVPLLAHPERYNYVMAKPKLAQELIQRGFLLQANLGSFSGMYGGQVAKTAKYLAKEGLYAIAASDIHSPKHAASTYIKGVEKLRKTVGDAGVNQLLIDGPAEILAG